MRTINYSEKIIDHWINNHRYNDLGNVNVKDH